MEEKLIEAVRMRQLLYDTSHVDYMRTKLKAEKWEEIAKEINMKSGAEAKALWEKLRHALRDAIRRKQKSFKNGAPAQAIKEWKYEKKMGFLKPYMTNKSREENLREDGNNENLEQTSEANITFGEVDTDIVEELDMHQQIKCPEEKEPHEIPETLLSTLATTPSSSATPEISKKFKRDNVAALIINFMEKREDRAKSRTEERKNLLESQNDPLFHFFMSMYQTTKKMPPSSQHIVKNRVFNAVTDVEATLLNIPMYKRLTPVYQQMQTYSQSSCNQHAATSSQTSNSTPVP